MSATVLVCGKIFDGSSGGLTGPAEILVERNRIAGVGQSVNRPRGTKVIDLSDRTVSLDFIASLQDEASDPSRCSHPPGRPFCCSPA